MTQAIRPKLDAVTPSTVFARTARGYAEAVDSQSALSPMLRHLLILLDGKSALRDLAPRYHHGDIHVAATLLWQHGYALPAAATAEAPKRHWLSRWFHRTSAPAAEFDDTLQSVFPPTLGDAKARFSESGRYWFSLGGLSLSQQAEPRERARTVAQPDESARQSAKAGGPPRPR